MTNILHIVGHIHVLDTEQLVSKMGLVQTDTTEQHPCLWHGRPCMSLGDDYGSAGGSWCAVAGEAGCSFPLLTGIRRKGDNDGSANVSVMEGMRLR